MLLNRVNRIKAGAAVHKPALPHLIHNKPVPAKLLKTRPSWALKASVLGEGTVHISEQFILVGSGIVSLVGPWAYSALRGSKVEQVSAADVPMMLDANTKLLDIRTEAQILQEGVPLAGSSTSSSVISAPWFVSDGGRLRKNERFEQDVLFAPNTLVNERTAFIILDSQGELCNTVAQAVAKLSNHHDIYTVTGGFKAWKAAGAPYSFKHAHGANGHAGNAHKLSSMFDMNTSGEMDDDMESSIDGEPVVPDPAARAEIMIDSGTRRSIFRPKILDVLAEGYTADNAREDVLAGLVVGVIALSLSMALGIASDSTPAIGLYTAVVAGFLISALGGSRVSVGGPTAAFIPIVVGVAQKYGAQNLVVCTGMAGAMLVAMGATGLGTVIKFIPRPVVTGFTAGIATFIFSTQIKDFLGLGAPGHLPEGIPIPAEFLEKIIFFGNHLSGVHGPSVALGVGCLALIKTWPKDWAKVVPPQIVAVIVGSLAMVGLEYGLGMHTGIETIGSHFGADAIPNSLPMPHWPEGATMEAFPGLVSPAFTIALLASIESLLCARVADTFIDDRHNPNTELIAQGVANIASAAFGGLPATGALARTAANVRAGGRSPVSGMVAAATVLAVMLVASPVAQYIPLPALSAVLVVVALNMGEWKNFTLLPSWPEKDAQLFLVAFTLTVLQDVSVAVEFGMVAAVILFVQDVTSSMHVRALPPSAPLHLTGLASLSMQPQQPLIPAMAMAGARNTNLAISSMDDGYGDSVSDSDADWKVASTHGHDGAALVTSPLALLNKVPSNAAYLEITGPLLFGAGDLLEEAMEEMHISKEVNAVVLDLSHVSSLDASGLEVMEEEYKKLRQRGKHLVLCGLARGTLRILSRAGFLDLVGRENVCADVNDALHRAGALAEQGGASLNGHHANGKSNILPITPMLGHAAPSSSEQNGSGGSAAGSPRGKKKAAKH